MISIEHFKQALKLPWTARRVFFVVSFGLLVYVFVRLLNDVITGTKFWLRAIETNAAEVIGCALISFVFEWVVNSFLLAAEKEDYSGSGKPWKPFLFLVAILQLVVVLFIFPLAEFTDDGLQWYDVIILSFVPQSAWLIYFFMRLSQLQSRKMHEKQLLVEQVSKDKLAAELEYLKAQFHPHFLFNALNTVYFQIQEDNVAARQTIEQLAALLRYQLYDQEDRVPLQEEFNHLDNYISLQRQRSSEALRLDVSWPKVAAAANGATIYPLLLLPLVENAFKFTGGDQWIRIRSELQQHQLRVQVENSIPSIAHHREKGGIGLVNLRKRLDLLYPGRYSLNLEKSDHSYSANLQIDL